MKTYRIAILGCRARGTRAATAYHAHPRTEVVGLCDLVEERRDELGEMLGVSARFDDLDEMIEDVQPDIVVIPTGTEFHHDLSMRVLEHGCHIDVEKPICIDLEQADGVMAEAAEKGARVAVHHQGRVGAFMQAVARAIEDGRIGDLRYVQASGKGYYGGYGLMNIGCHALNTMIKFTGHCRSVSAVALTAGRRITLEDVVPSPSGMGTIAGEHITAALEFDGGVTASLLQHRFAKMNPPSYGVLFCGTEGRVLWRSSGAWWLGQPHDVPNGAEGRWRPLDPIYAEHFGPDGDVGEADYWFAEEYVRALDEERDHECSGAEALHVLEIMMGVFESAAYGRRVDLPQERRDHPLLRWRRENGLGDPAPMPRDYGKWLAEEDRRLRDVSG